LSHPLLPLTLFHLAIVTARSQLSTLKNYRHNLNNLLPILKAANLPDLDESILMCYRGRRTQRSDQFVELTGLPSTIASRNQYNMSNFDLSSLVGDSRVNVEFVQLDSNCVKEYVIATLFNDDEDQYQGFINEMKDILCQLRCMFEYLRTEEYILHELTFYQPIFTMFLERFRDRLANPWQHSNGSTLIYSLTVEVQDENEVEPHEVQLTGKPDIFVHSGDFLIENVKFQVELKPPFSALYHSAGDLEKTQLICELMGHRDMLQDVPDGCFGVLTDFFRILLGFNFHQNPEHFYICQSVVDADNYLNFFALMFCADYMEQKTILALADISSQPKHDRRKKDPDPKKRRLLSTCSSKRLAGRQISKTKNTTAKQTSKQTSGQRGKPVCYFGPEFDEIEDANRALEQWYAEHFNQLHLTSESLREHVTRVMMPI
jgi:hypothetical protein